MKKEKEKYYGIRFNNDIPKINNENKYSKEVEVKFIGKAYLITKKEDDKIEKVEMENYYKLKKEGVYEIEFINSKEEMYLLQVRIEKSYLFLIIFIILGILAGLLFYKPANFDNPLINKFFNYIDFSILSLDIDNSSKTENQYEFDVSFGNISSDEISLLDTIDGKAVTKNKIAPGISGEFSIVIITQNSSVDMNYVIDFENMTDEKPENMLFRIKGNNKEYSSLQELQKELNGIAKKKTKTIQVIEWYWPYESNIENDFIDTDNGKNFETYKFKINVKGEEVI